jgi:hypothetical protein
MIGTGSAGIKLYTGTQVGNPTGGNKGVGTLNIETGLYINNVAVPSGYPGVGIALSTGSAWATSITNNSTNWNTAYDDRMKWDGGSTGLVAATGRSSLGLGTSDSPSFAIVGATSYMIINNEAYYGGYCNDGTTPKVLIKLNSSNLVKVGTSCPSYLDIADSSTLDDPIRIRVGAISNKQVTVGDIDSAGTGYRLLRVVN